RSCPPPRAAAARPPTGLPPAPVQRPGQLTLPAVPPQRHVPGAHQVAIDDDPVVTPPHAALLRPQHRSPPCQNPVTQPCTDPAPDVAAGDGIGEPVPAASYPATVAGDGYVEGVRRRFVPAGGS